MSHEMAQLVCNHACKFVFVQCGSDQFSRDEDAPAGNHKRVCIRQIDEEKLKSKLVQRQTVW